jgi:preprotein translocase subunit SecE
MEEKPGTSKVGGWWKRLTTFLHEVRVELTKVTWPTWAQLKQQTLVVIIAVLMISAFIGAVDLLLSNTIKFLVTRLT